MEILFKKYLWIVYLVLICFGSLFLAKIAATLIASKLRIPRTLQVGRPGLAVLPSKARISFDDYKIVLDRNIFDSRELAPEVVPSAEPTQQANLEGPAVKTTLNIKLISTFSVGDGEDKRSSATVVSGSTQEIYTIGDEKQFSPGVKITKILPDRIEFINGPRLEFAEIEKFGSTLTTSRPISSIERPRGPMTLPGKDSVQQVEAGKFVVDRAELDAAFSNLDQLFTQIRAVPQFQGGKPSGLKLLSVRGGSFFSKLGLKRNDVLERINGQEMDMKRGMEIFGQLKDASQISIDLVRDG
ncbi:MAG TPA: hypothetical protein DF383_04000, partial [Deltaproteobacteria bacterium]|nr:hypothetical protein [Deltaproteobacteria bacterium]